MTAPLVILAFFSVVVAWGWPIWDAEASVLEHQLHHSQHEAVVADFGMVLEHDRMWEGGAVLPPERSSRYWAMKYHHLAGNLALGVVVLGIVFAWVVYYRRALDPEEAREQFPAVHRFLMHKWYFDELYSAVLVRPALAVAGFLKAFDLRVIDGAIHGLARGTVLLSRWDGLFDRYVVDGLVNVTGNVIYGVGGWLRTWQTGYLRSYVLFLVLAAVGIFIVFSSL
jgi:NADH-quinone oxidoreductase subunit L